MNEFFTNNVTFIDTINSILYKPVTFAKTPSLSRDGMFAVIVKEEHMKT